MKNIGMLLFTGWFVIMPGLFPVEAQESDDMEEYYDDDGFDDDEDDDGGYDDDDGDDDTNAYPQQLQMHQSAENGSYPQGEVDVDYFRKKLSPYGEWVWTSEHGWVWRPFNMKPDWRPYTYGRWVYTDWGWTWSSYFDWGWAPFHYGRWNYMNPFGWIWVPGTKWGPAWVAWRYSDSHIGWTPLLAGYNDLHGWNYYPVHYNHWSFVTWNLFYDPHPYHHYTHHRHLRHLFHRTHYPRKCRSHWGRSCLRGPSRKMVVHRQGRPVHRMRIKHVGLRAGRSKRTGIHMGVDGDRLRLHRPHFRKNPSRVERVRNQKTPMSKMKRFDAQERSRSRLRSRDDRINSSSSRRSKRSNQLPKITPRRPLPGRSINPEKPSIHREMRSMSRTHPRKSIVNPPVRSHRNIEPKRSLPRSEPVRRSESRSSVRIPRQSLPQRRPSPPRSPSRQTHRRNQ